MNNKTHPIQPPARRRKKQRGWGLTETLLTLGALTVMSVAIYAVFKPSDATAQIRIEQDNLHVLSRNVDRSFGLLGTFEDVTTERVVNDELAPSRMLISGNEIRTQWGTVATVAPYEDPAKGVMPNTAFSVTYPGAPREVCAGLAAAMARDAFDILVDGQSVYDAEGMSPAAAAERCAQGNATMEFVFHSGLVAGQAVAAPPTLILPPTPPSTSTPPPAPPAVTTPTNPGVDDATPGVIPTPGGGGVVAPPPLPPVAPPPTPTPPAPTPPPPPVAPPGQMCDPSPTMTTQHRELPCGPGYLGEIHEMRTQTQHHTCPEAWGAPDPAHVENGPWTETSNTCALECVVPSPATQTRAGTPATRNLTQERTVTVYEDGTPVTRTQSCPSGYMGEIEQERPTRRSRSATQTRTQPQTRTTTQTRTASCPAPTGNYVWGGWSSSGAPYGSWTNNGSPSSWSAPKAPYGSWSGYSPYGSWTTTSDTCTLAMTGKCDQFSRPIGWGCGSIRFQGGSWVHVPGSVWVNSGTNGGNLGNGTEGTRCVLGYTDSLTPQGYPSPLSATDSNRIVYDYIDTAPDWLESDFRNLSDGSWTGRVGYGRVYARTASGPPRGDMCLNTKFEFMNN